MQIGAAFTLPSRQLAQPTTRVPVGMSAVVLQSSTPGVKMHAQGALADLKEDGSVFSQYSMHTDKPVPALFIMDMRFKSAHSHAAGSNSETSGPVRKSASQSKQATCNFYVEQWLVAGVLLPRAKALCGPSAVLANVSSDVSHILPKRNRPSQVLHQLQSLQGRAQVQLRTRNVQLDRLTGPCGVSSCQSSAAAVGLLRVAMQEMPAAALQHLDLATGITCKVTKRTLAGLEGTLDQNLQLQSLVTECSPGSSIGQNVNMVGSGILITGGLGEIGSIVAGWTAAECQNGHLWLLGRSGRGRLVHGLKCANSSVTASACDTSYEADMVALHDCFGQVRVSEMLFCLLGL